MRSGPVCSGLRCPDPGLQFPHPLLSPPTPEGSIADERSVEAALVDGRSMSGVGAMVTGPRVSTGRAWRLGEISPRSTRRSAYRAGRNCWRGQRRWRYPILELPSRSEATFAKEAASTDTPSSDRSQIPAMHVECGFGFSTGWQSVQLGKHPVTLMC